MAITPLEYYEDSSLYGNYQYLSLEEIINNYMAYKDSDDYTSMSKRHAVIYQAKRGIRELYYDTLREIKAFAMEISPSLMITVPPDFVSLVRVSWIDEHGQLHPIASDNRMSMAMGYLQDNNYELLFDENGCVLTANELVDYDSSNVSVSRYIFAADGFSPNINLSNVYSNGKYIFDKSMGVLRFSSDIFSKNVVIEYISDGLYIGCETQSESDIKIHKFAESALLNFIYYELIKNRRSIPANEKLRAKKEYFNSKRIVKRRMNNLKVADILQSFKSANHWIKI